MHNVEVPNFFSDTDPVTPNPAKEERIVLSREYNLNRLKEEALEGTVSRLKANIKNLVEKHFGKKLKKNKDKTKLEVQQRFDEFINAITVNVHDKSDVTLNYSVTTESALVAGHTLSVMGQRYFIEVNSPNVFKMKLPSVLTAGFPVYPKLELEFADPLKSKYVWYSLAENEDTTSRKRRRTDSIPAEDWKEICHSYTCNLTDQEIGKKIKLECIPSDGERDGKAVVAECTTTVQEGPGTCPFERRQTFTENHAPVGRYVKEIAEV
jgi:2',5'-phosphodiesterase